MAEDNGFIVIHRKIMQWEWYTDANTYRVFTHLLYLANHKETRWRGEVIQRGQVLTGRHQLSRELRISERGIRTALEHLKTTNEVTIKTTNQFSVITINNYCEYQSNENNKRPAKRPAERQTTDQRPTTSNNDNNVNKKNSLSESSAADNQVKVFPANPGFSQDFMVKVWPYYLKTGKAKYKNVDSQSVALRSLHKESGGDEKTAIEALQYAVANGYQGFQWYFKHKQKTNGHEQRNGTLVHQQPITAATLPDIMQSIADDPRYR